VRFVVVRTVKVGQRAFRQARLVIINVPEHTDAGTVMVALECAGRATEFADGGMAWGNHEVRPERRLAKGTVGVDEAPVIGWAELAAGRTTLRRITLRLEPADYDMVYRAARRTNTSLQAWCVDALRKAAIDQG
jgi:hypothetical protein